MKKFFLSGLSLVVATSPIISVIACGDSVKTTDEGKKLVSNFYDAIVLSEEQKDPEKENSKIIDGTIDSLRDSINKALRFLEEGVSKEHKKSFEKKLYQEDTLKDFKGKFDSFLENGPDNAKEDPGNSFPRAWKADTLSDFGEVQKTFDFSRPNKDDFIKYILFSKNVKKVKADAWVKLTQLNLKKEEGMSQAIGELEKLASDENGKYIFLIAGLSNLLDMIPNKVRQNIKTIYESFDINVDDNESLKEKEDKEAMSNIEIIESILELTNSLFEKI